MNGKNTFNDTPALSAKFANDNTKIKTKEETTMNKNIFDAINEIKKPEFRQDMMKVSWEVENINLDYYKLFWNQDDIAVIRMFKQKNLGDNEFRRIIHRFCDMGDSKKRCRELAAAFDHGDYIAKKGHIDGRLVIIVQILVD